MAWQEIEVQVNQETFSAHKQGEVFSIPFASGLTEGSSFMAAGVKIEVASVVNWADRDEILLVTAKEVKNDKPKARRASVGDGGEGVPLPDHNGHNDPN